MDSFTERAEQGSIQPHTTVPLFLWTGEIGSRHPHLPTFLFTLAANRGSWGGNPLALLTSSLESRVMKQRLKNALGYSAYLGIRTVSFVCWLFPPQAALAFAYGLGNAWFTVPHHPWAVWLADLSKVGRKLKGRFQAHRLRAEEHIRYGYPDLPDEEISAIARGSMQQLCLMVIELIMTPRLITRWAWHDYVSLRNLGDAIRVLSQKKKGCILITGHYGNIEVLGTTLAMIGFDMTAVMRPLDSPYINKLLKNRRRFSGLKLLDKKGATIHAPEILQSGGALAFIADQNAGRKGVFVDFFGRKASTYKSIALLAMQFEVPVVVGCARRTGKWFNYEMHVNRVILPEEWGDKDDPLLWITEEYTTALEGLIREAPEQYLWIHRRWKTRPKGEVADAA